MVVRDLDVARTIRPCSPGEADAPLPVDPNTELTLSVAFQSFQSVARQLCQIIQARCRFEKPKTFLRLLPKRLELRDVFPVSELLGSAIPEASNHATRYVAVRVTSSIQIEGAALVRLFPTRPVPDLDHLAHRLMADDVALLHLRDDAVDGTLPSASRRHTVIVVKLVIAKDRGRP